MTAVERVSFSTWRVTGKARSALVRRHGIQRWIVFDAALPWVFSQEFRRKRDAKSHAEWLVGKKPK